MEELKKTEEFIFMGKLAVEARIEAEEAEKRIHPDRKTGSIPRPEMLLERTPGSILRNVSWDVFYNLLKFLKKTLRQRGYPVSESFFGLAFIDGKFILLIREEEAAKKLGLETETYLEASRPELIIPEVREKISNSQSKTKH
jgi:hypothetical protein